MTDARKSDLLLLVSTLLAAMSWMFSKEAVSLMPPLMFMAVRFLMAGSILALLAHRHLRRMSAEQLIQSARVGLVFGIAMSCWVTGLFLGTHLGEGAFLTSLGVVIVPIIARVLFKEAQPTSTWLAIPVAVSGLALLSLENGFRPELGQLFFIAAAFIFALYFTLNTRAANNRMVTNRAGESRQKDRVPALPLTAIALLTVAVVTTSLSALLEPWVPTLNSLSWAMVWWVSASAIIGTAGRFLVQTYAQSLSVHSHGVVILIVEPVWVALFAAGWFDESMTITQVGGCAVIFTALLINRWTVFSRVTRGWLKQRG
ncbi:MAG: DMT family transporter [Marinobacter sp.]|uniref:DMT family transporter n=1 Tax=Marinobacter sp. TaxID=50741 RepID=UPI0034A010F2